MYYQPSTLNEALEKKAQPGACTRFLAGGTDLISQMNLHELTPGILIDISCLKELDFLREENGEMLIGAGRRVAVLAGERINALSEAARRLGSPQIRAVATLGGSLGTASPASDLSTVLLALGAKLTLISIRGKRTLPLQEFFTGPGMTTLAPDELILSVSFRQPFYGAFYKLANRRSFAVSVVCIAVSLSQESRVRIAAGNVGPTPLRLYKAEKFLKEEGLNLGTISESARIAKLEVNPASDLQASGEYRREMIEVLVHRLLTELAEESFSDVT